MATLNNEEIKKKKKRRRNAVIMLVLLILVFSPWIAEALDGGLRGIFNYGKFDFDFNYIKCLKELLVQKNRIVMVGGVLLFAVGFFIMNLSIANPTITSGKTVEVAKGIKIPVPAGNGEYGSDWFMSEEEKKKVFETCEYSPEKGFSFLSKEAGLIVDFCKKNGKEVIKYLAREAHAIILGITGQGKTRRLLLTSTWLDICAGINLCITDVKGEIYAYTSPFAKKMGYKEIVIDFREPEKGMHHNYLTDIIKFLKEGNIPEATDRTWDLVSSLVGEPKGEKLWNNGECAAIAAAILIVAQDAPEDCKNLTNVCYFLQYMCKMDEMGIMPITLYLKKLPEAHPARGAFGSAEIAPSRTRSSFFTSALSTLRLFTGYNIAEMTRFSDYDMEEIDEQKTIIYLIIPDEKRTRYELATLYIDQLYVKLLDIAKKKGGSLDRKFIFRWDEFGNCPKVAMMGGKMSAGRGRNIFFELYIQDYQQLEENYKEEAENIKANARLKMYLGSDNDTTLKSLSTACGNYTIETGSASASASEGHGSSINYSANANLIGRPVLYPKEVEKIEPPEALAFYTGKDVAVVNIPDISQWYCNQELGLGDKEFNRKLYQKIHESRESRSVGEPKLWGIWNKYRMIPEPEHPEADKKVSFL